MKSTWKIFKENQKLKKKFKDATLLREDRSSNGSGHDRGTGQAEEI